jgi:apolipoprotein N-acyltransferase
MRVLALVRSFVLKVVFLNRRGVFSAGGAQVIFILTNDEWFRGTNAPWEHAVMGALRAVENNVAVAQAANGGYSFAVDRYGRFMVKTSINTAQTIAVDLALPQVPR